MNEQPTNKQPESNWLRNLLYLWDIFVIVAFIVRAFYYGQLSNMLVHWVLLAAAVVQLIQLILEDSHKEELAEKFEKIGKVLYVLCIFSGIIQTIIHDIIFYFEVVLPSRR